MEFFYPGGYCNEALLSINKFIWVRISVTGSGKFMAGLICLES